MSSSKSTNSFMSQLWERRFFQYLATYIGVCWGVLQFIQFGVLRYKWNSSLIDMFLIFALAMIPAICVFIYNHGKVGDDEWRPFEKWFIPVNFVFAAVLGFFSLSTNANSDGKSETVTLTTDEGNTITRSVPSMDLAKRLVVFPFVNSDNNQDKKWLRFGFPVLIHSDISQDMRISSGDPINMGYHYKAYSQELSDDISSGTKLEIARDMYVDYYIEGDFKLNGNVYNVVINARNTSDGSLFFTKEYSDESYFNIVDQFTIDIEEEMYSKEHFESTEIVDLPANEMVSKNEECLKSFIEGNLSSSMTGDLNKSKEMLENAVKADPNCAICYFELARIDSGLNQPENALKNIEKALQYSSSQTERNRLEIRYRAYSIKRETDKSRKLLETWMKLYPHDGKPYLRLMSFYKTIMDRNSEIQVGEKALENGHKGYFYTDLADAYIATQNFEKAEELLKKSAELYPNKSKENMQLGDILLRQGKIDEAIAFYENQEIVNGETYDLALNLAKAYTRKAHFLKADKLYQKSFSLCKQSNDSLTVYSGLRTFFLAQGMANKAIESYFESEVVARRIAPEIYINSSMYFSACFDFYYAGREDEWMNGGLARFPTVSNEQDKLIVDMLNYLNAMLKEDLVKYEKYYTEIKDFYLKTVGESYEIYSDGFAARLKGDYPLAIAKFEEYVALTNSDYTSMTSTLCDTYLKNGEAQKSLDYANNVLIIEPHNTLFLLENIKSNFALGNTKAMEEARMNLEKTLINADSTFRILTKYHDFLKQNSIE